jgi:hypothetical protein
MGAYIHYAFKFYRQEHTSEIRLLHIDSFAFDKAAVRSIIRKCGSVEIQLSGAVGTASRFLHVDFSVFIVDDADSTHRTL